MPIDIEILARQVEPEKNGFGTWRWRVYSIRSAHGKRTEGRTWTGIWHR